MIPTTIYVAGPMRGIPGFNFDAFARARVRLREAGWSVICPAERDETLGFSGAGLTGRENPAEIGFDLPGALEQCFRDVLSVDAVALLPGWGRSEGARAEALVALMTGRRCYAYLHHRPVPLEPIDGIRVRTIAEAIR